MSRLLAGSVCALWLRATCDDPPPPPPFPLSPRVGYSPDVVSFNTAIDACAPREKWQEAVELLEVDMPGAKVRDRIVYGVVRGLGARGMSKISCVDSLVERRGAYVIVSLNITNLCDGGSGFSEKVKAYSSHEVLHHTHDRI